MDKALAFSHGLWAIKFGPLLLASVFGNTNNTPSVAC